MKRQGPPLWLCVLLLLLVLVWRMLGAPLTAREFAQAGTPLWQARTLLPTRVRRVFSLWLPVQKEKVALTDDTESLTPLPDEERDILVFVTQENRMVSMSLSGYVCGVVAAEMPASYHLEALKAQAVAARTRLLKQRQTGGCVSHPGADICTDSAHCQGYATLQECKARWGDAYEAYRDRVLQAEYETRGQWLAYQGRPITVVYHAISGGRTEDAQAVFSQAEPYLVSVSSEGEEQVRGFWQDSFFSFEELAEKLTAAGYPVNALQARQRLTISAYTAAGRVAAMQVGDQIIDGGDFRRALGLRSTWFSISADDQGVTFSQRGYGHGVGMSQAGANAMAAGGANYQEILTHYYPGVEIQVSP